MKTNRALVASAVAALVWGTGCSETNPQGHHGPQAVVPADSAQLARASFGSSQQHNQILETVALFTGPMPTGVTVSQEGRIFLSFPRWTDPVDSTVAELRDGNLIPYPSALLNRFDRQHPDSSLVSVQSVVASEGRLWIVDTGNINFGQNYKNAPKLLAVDLKTDQVVQTIHFPDSVCLPTSYLNDIRFDHSKHLAYLTDSSVLGANGIIVVNLTTGQSWRKLSDHPSVKAVPNFAPLLVGESDNPLMTRQVGKPPEPIKVGSDGIALSPDAQTLYYRPLASNHLYSVPTSLLADPSIPDDQVGSAVKDMGDLGFASDGLLCDSQGRLYLTDYNHHAIRRGDPSQSPFKPQILIADQTMIWPDTLSFSSDGYLYITSNQLNRQPNYHLGKDLRVPPYALFRLKTDSTPTR